MGIRRFTTAEIRTRPSDFGPATMLSLCDQLDILRDALEWYANERNYDSDFAPGTPEFEGPDAGWDADAGHRAREALKRALHK